MQEKEGFMRTEREATGNDLGPNGLMRVGSVRILVVEFP